jgi:uncharacterized protein DUF6496
MPRKRSGRRKYGPKASQKVERAMHEFKHGQLKSGRSGRTVKSRKQAIAIGLSEARERGAKVPNKPGARRRKSSSGGRKSSSTRSRSAKASRSSGGRSRSRRKSSRSRQR